MIEIPEGEIRGAITVSGRPHPGCGPIGDIMASIKSRNLYRLEATYPELIS